MLFSPQMSRKSMALVSHFFFKIFMLRVAAVKLSRDVTEVYEKSTRFYKIICYWIFEVVGFAVFANFSFPLMVTYCLVIKKKPIGCLFESFPAPIEVYLGFSRWQSLSQASSSWYYC